MPFNKEQQAAIDARGKTILVSAPAGSGKTRILVSRMDSLILNDGYDMNAFLVLTFTEAAGAEMKQRLNDQLHQDLKNDQLTDQQKAHIHTCIDQLPNAYMTTFDSFCKSLLTKYGYLVGVMPGFEVLASPELIKSQILDECVNEWINEADFQDYLKRYNRMNSLDAFKTMLMDLESKTNSFVDFTKTLEGFHDQYYTFDDFNDSPLLPLFQKLYEESVRDCLSNFNTLDRFCQANSLDIFYEGTDNKPSNCDSLYNYLSDLLKGLSHQQTYDSLCSLLNGTPEKPVNMAWKEAGVDDKVKKQFNDLKKKVLDPLSSIKDDLMIEDMAEFKELLSLSYKDIAYLLGRDGLLERYEEAYKVKKAQMGVLDFHDLEDYATQLLSENLPVLRNLNNTFKEIMLDEYQDTNQIQENLVARIAGQSDLSGYHEIPMFMVGDMKQSIYRFRQADPRIFKEKFDSYVPYEQAGPNDTHIRIDLRFNYRSEKAVLDSINYIFDSIMDTSIGGLEYVHDPFAILRYDHDAKGKTLEELKPIHDYDSEVLLAFHHGSKDATKDELEANMVAQKIIKMVEQGYSLSDFCVLMRTTTNFMTYKKIFENYGIDANITLSKGLMSSNEVLSMVALLKAINNPNDDIAMTSVLHNHFLFSSFDENELLGLRDFSDPDNMDSMYHDLLKHQEEEKVAQFLEAFNRLQILKTSASPYEILKACHIETGYREFVSGLVNGQQREANLDAFLELARTSDDLPYLQDFLDFCDANAERSPGKISSDHNEAVEFMTIHKSKGLQFKVVFVCGMQRQFNMMDENASLLLDKDKGIASKYMFYKDTPYGNMLAELNHPYRNMIKRYIHKEAVNEEMRILYVALTRAESKLILTGVLDDEKKLKTLARQVQANDYDESADPIVFNHQMRNVKCYMDWILAALMRHPEFQQDLITYVPSIAPLLALNKKRFAKLNNAHTALARFHLTIQEFDTIMDHSVTMQREKSEDIYPQVAKYYEYQYPYLDEKRSIAVTDLQELSAEKHVTNASEMGTMERRAAMDFGTLVHNVLYYFTFDHDDPKAIITALNEQGMFTKDEYQAITDYLPHLERFVESPLYTKIAQADQVYKEKSFRYVENDQVINGTFDVVFFDDQGVHVLDYKTDRVSKKNPDSKLRQKHLTQMTYYKHVLSSLGQDVYANLYYLNIDTLVNV